MESVKRLYIRYANKRTATTRLLVSIKAIQINNLGAVIYLIKQEKVANQEVASEAGRAALSSR